MSRRPEVNTDELEKLLNAKGPSDWIVIWDAPNLAIGAGTYRVVQTPNQNNYGHYGSSQRWLGIESTQQAALIVAAVNALPELLAVKAERDRAQRACEQMGARITALEAALDEIARCERYLSEADTNYEYEMRQIELCRFIKTRAALAPTKESQDD